MKRSVYLRSAIAGITAFAMAVAAKRNVCWKKKAYRSRKKGGDEGYSLSIRCSGSPCCLEILQSKLCSR